MYRGILSLNITIFIFLIKMPMLLLNIFSIKWEFINWQNNYVCQDGNHFYYLPYIIINSSIHLSYLWIFSITDREEFHLLSKQYFKSHLR